MTICQCVLVVVSTLLWAGASPARAADPVAPAADARLDAVADHALAFIHDGEPGCVVGVIRRGTVVFRRARGLANLDVGAPLTPSSVFYIASMSKQFTAMSIALLAEDGTLDLDDDIRKWLPELPRYPTPIRIRHLLHHTGGLREVNDLFPLAGFTGDDLVPPEAGLDLVVRQRAPDFPAGTEAQYSNTGFFLLGLIVERASKMQLPQFSAERIFGPLGMTHSAFVADHQRTIAGRAMSYEKGRDGWFQVFSQDRLIGDGGVFTTLDDLARWDANFYAPIIGKRSATALLTTRAFLDDGAPLRISRIDRSYGAGIFLGPRLGLSAEFHGGQWLGYRADMTRFRDEGLTFVSLCNRRDIGDSWTVAQPIAEALLPARAQPDPPLPPTKQLDAAQLARLTGSYLGDIGWRDITVTDGVLRWMPFGLAFDAVDDHTFRLRNDPNLVFQFVPRAGGAMELHAIFPDTPTRVLTRVPPPQHVVLADYVGRYRSEEVEELVLAAHDGKLRMRARWVPEWPLTPITNDVFVVPDRMLVVRFTRDARGRVSGFRLSTLRAHGMVYRRAP